MKSKPSVSIDIGQVIAAIVELVKTWVNRPKKKRGKVDVLIIEGLDITEVVIWIAERDPDITFVSKGGGVVVIQK